MERSTHSPFKTSVRSHRDISAEGRGDEPPYPDASRLSSFVTFPRTIAAPNQEDVTVSAQPQLPFKPRRISIDPRCAEHFDVIDIRIGRNSMLFNGGGGAPATCFPPIASDAFSLENLQEIERLLSLNVDTANINQFVSLRVRNRSKEQQEFRAIVWGDAPER